MTSYNTIDNYTEGRITGVITKIITPREFALKDDDGNIYYCIIQRKDITTPIVGDTETYYGLIENSCRSDKYPIEMLVRS
jgi:hypothetical protein